MKVLKKILSALFSLLIVSIISFSTEGLIESKVRGVSSCCGISVVEVLSPSMEASDIDVGEIYFIQYQDDYEVGDVVAFHYSTDIWLHEIMSYDKENDIIQTKGSSNVSADPFTITKKDVIGRNIGGGITLTNYLFIRIGLLMFLYMVSMKYLWGCLLHVLSENKLDNISRADIKIYNPRFKRDKVKVVKIYKSPCLLLLIASISIIITNITVAYCSTYQNINLNSSISYVVPITKNTIIENLKSLLQDSSSSVHEYFSSRYSGSHLDSHGSNWGPKVRQELADMMGCDVSEIEDVTWVIYKHNSSYGIYYTEEDITSYSVGDTISKVYKYNTSTDELSYSTAKVGLGFSGRFFNTINTPTYDTTNKTIIS